jgi:hypothetical protein
MDRTGRLWGEVKFRAQVVRRISHPFAGLPSGADAR